MLKMPTNSANKIWRQSVLNTSFAELTFADLTFADYPICRTIGKLAIVFAIWCEVNTHNLSICRNLGVQYYLSTISILVCQFAAVNRLICFYERLILGYFSLFCVEINKYSGICA